MPVSAIAGMTWTKSIGILAHTLRPDTTRARRPRFVGSNALVMLPWVCPLLAGDAFVLEQCDNRSAIFGLAFCGLVGRDLTRDAHARRRSDAGRRNAVLLQNPGDGHRP